MLFPEIGPEHIGHIQFRISQLPEHKITDTHFATGSDHEFRIGNSARAQVLTKHGFINLIGGQFTIAHVGGQLPGSFQNFPPAAITKGQNQG